MKASKELISLFVECVNAQLPKDSKVSLNIVANTIQYFANMAGFNKFPLFYWQTVCSANGIKYQL